MSKRKFVLLDSHNKDTSSAFAGTSPSAAAKKAAIRGHKKILLRETGTKDVHHYKGKIVKLKIPKVVTHCAGKREVVYSKQAVVTKVAKFNLE